MSRLYVHSLALCGAALALLGGPSVSRADAMGDGMCVVVHAAAFEVGLNHSVDPAELETSDPTAVPATPFEAPEGHLVCAHADDPRCSPLSAEDSPSAPEMPARVSATLVDPLPLPLRPLRRVEHGEPDLLGPAAGAHSGLERPPRG